jgi:hypothetical protein
MSIVHEPLIDDSAAAFLLRGHDCVEYPRHTDCQGMVQLAKSEFVSELEFRETKFEKKIEESKK